MSVLSITSEGNLCSSVNHVLETLIATMKDILARPLSETLLIENYSVLCLAIDEIILEVEYFVTAMKTHFP